MNDCEKCRQPAMYKYRDKANKEIWFCFEHAPKAQNNKRGNYKKPKAEEKPIKLTEEKTGALYYDK